MESQDKLSLDEVMEQLDPEFKVKKAPTMSEYKKAMRHLFTQRNQQVDACGHKFHPIDPPRTNCDDCWVAYFQVHGEITKLCDEIFREQGIDTLKRLKGDKYAKNFIRFMSGLAQLQKERSEQSVGNVSNNSSSREEGRTESNTDDSSGEMESAGGGREEFTEGL